MSEQAREFGAGLLGAAAQGSQLKRDNSLSQSNALHSQSVNLAASSNQFNAHLEEQSSNSNLRHDYSLRESIQNLSVQKTIEMNGDGHKIIIPPAEALIQKSVFTKEEAKTGAPISFLKL